ncbi:MAG: mandelate racemase/muconate lactonizing enzyme family protein [Blastocatellia bacterium]|nr:mandelate racemase/muconate lactonizing enzyme family protein [Blastocatellia bacterium]
MAISKHKSEERPRRNFLKQMAGGLTGSLLAGGAGTDLAWAGQQAKQDGSLKIVKIEPHLLTGIRGYGPWLFVRVETAEGIVGWGEGTNFPGVQPIATAVKNLRQAVIGESAWDIEKLWNRMYRYMYYNGMGGIVLAAISGIDTALYDIVGKKLGVPVYQLLGGQVHEKLRIYANGWIEGIPRTPEAFAARTKELVAKGYTGCKFDPFSVSPMNREVTQPDLRSAVAQVRAIREAGGPDYDIAIDVHGRWSTKSTLEIIRALEPYRLFFYEEAVPPENIAAMAEVQRNVAVPLATGERIFGRHGFRELLERQAVRIIQPDLARTGGVTEFRKIASMADTYYIPVAPHNPNGPICTIASMHACFAIPNFLILEFFEPDEPVYKEIVAGGLRGDKGSLYPITAPGLGINITDDFLRKYKFDEARTDEMERRTFNTAK